MSSTYLVRVIVLCINSEGAPEFHTCTPEVTDREESEGVYYERAKENAAFNGYEAPMIAFSRGDPAYEQLADVLAWS